MRSQIRVMVFLILTAALVGAVVTAFRVDLPGRPFWDGPGAATETAAVCSQDPPPAPLASAVDERMAGQGVAPVAAERIEVSVVGDAQNVATRDADRVRARAAALATKLALSAADEEALLAVLLEEQERRSAAFAERRSGSDPADGNARMRSQLDAILVWKTKVLSDRFGLARATVMMRR